MNKGMMVWVLAIVIILLALWWFVAGISGNEEIDTIVDDGNNLGSSGEVGEIDNGDEGGNGMGDIAASTHTIEMSSSGFSPGSLTINIGDTVSFLAVDGAGRWPASNIHPTHTLYPGSNIDKCGTGEENNIFDSCGAVTNGESFIFTFYEIGKWNYHDHKAPGEKGTITVVS